MATKAIVGEKVGMTQVWTEDGRVVPVTVVRVQAARVVQVKTTETDGYSRRAGHVRLPGPPQAVQAQGRALRQGGASKPGAASSSSASTTSRATRSAPRSRADTFEAGERVDVTAV